jgi:hypothetical protein
MPVIGSPSGLAYRCNACNNALRKAASRLDADPFAQDYSPLKSKKRPNRSLGDGGPGEQPRGSPTPRGVLWAYANADDAVRSSAALAELVRLRQDEKDRLENESVLAASSLRLADEAVRLRETRAAEYAARFAYSAGDYVIYRPLTGTGILLTQRCLFF